MKIIILAAGKGTRLGNELNPKPLTLLDNGKTILEMQLATFQRVVDPSDIFVVVGYLKEHIMQKYPLLQTIENLDYANENTSKSLLKALDQIDCDDTLWVNGDVVFHPSILNSLILLQHSAMVVNRAAVGEEEIKYRTNSDHHIVEVSKHVIDPEGEAVGINFFIKEEIPLLKKNLIACENSDYFERAVELCIQSGIRVFPLEIESAMSIEIDFYKDLQRANRLLKQWTGCE